MTEVSQVLSTSPAAQPAATTPAWNEGLPEPKSQAEGVSAEYLAELMKSVAVGKEFIVVDVRRTDFEVNL